MKKEWKLLMALVAIIFTTSQSCAIAQKQNKKDNSALIAQLVNQKEFVFKAQTALPMGGAMRMLTNEYDLIISADSVISFLPYFGRAFTPPIDPSKNSLDFTTTDFSYSVEPTKKSNFNITIEPKDNRDIRILNLFVSSGGNATLNVTHFNKEPITFRGYITSRQNL